MSDSIYLDNQATTPTDPRVRAALLPFLEIEHVGNPHSEHFAGGRAAAAVETAREQVASLIGAAPHEIVFTSGATEANNLALQGLSRSSQRRGNHLITFATEHKCVLETVRYLGRHGFNVEILPVSSDGLIEPAALAAAITPETFLVTAMAANNEIGVVQRIEDLAAVCRSRGVLFHTDAAQAVGKIPLDVHAMGIDLLSLSGHKIYAPIGIGVLFISEDSTLKPEPLFWGGGQERGLRSGTVAPHLCVALGAASVVAAAELEVDALRIGELRDLFLRFVRERYRDVRVNGSLERRLPGNLSLTFPGCDADRLVGALQPDISISTNAACNGGVLQPSHVLVALGLSETEATSTIRVGVGRFNTRADVEHAAVRIAEMACRIRERETETAAA